jgi:hypothetical protein
MDLFAVAPISVPTRMHAAGTALSASPIASRLQVGPSTNISVPEDIIHFGGTRRATPRVASVLSRSVMHRRYARSM